jgi:hypothetical protein
LEVRRSPWAAEVEVRVESTAVVTARSDEADGRRLSLISCQLSPAVVTARSDEADG